MDTRYVVQRDTGSWRVQVWTSFAIAMVCATLGVLQLPGQELDRAFLAVSLLFCLFATLAVSKTVRDNRDGQVDTNAWVITVWIAFAAAVTLTAWGLYRMKIEDWQKYYMLVTWMFLISSSFTLAKMLRDQQEADLLERRAAAPAEERAQDEAQPS